MAEATGRPGLRVARLGIVLLTLAAVAACTGSGDDGPQAEPTAAQAPCGFHEIDVAKYGGQELRNPPEVGANGKTVTTDLEVRYSDKSETEIAGCPVHLRTYNGELVGPTLRLKPGQTLDLKLRNDLPEETPAQVKAQLEQETSQAHLATVPHTFNTTNLHTHGLHVSPRGNSDNVLLAVPPQTTQPYHFEIPEDHPPGSFWYHAHGHGSTAIQVGSGMAGAIVIEDDEDAIPPALAAANEREKVMLFQTTLYDTSGEVETIAAFFPDSPATKKLCEAGDPGCTWQNSHRRTTINGQVVPRITMRPGEVQRWRMIDGGFREELRVQLEGHSLHEIALDGLYLGRIDTWRPAQSVLLEPGYRSDVLVQASSEPGTYKLMDLPTPEENALRPTPEDAEILAEVVVRGDPIDMDLPTNEEMASLAPFPGVDLATDAVDVEVAQFKIGSDVNTDPKKSKNYFQINFEAFDPKRVRRVALGTTAQWSLSTVGDPADVGGQIPPLPHVFHIHVNPFQVVRLDPDGNEEPVWKDTLLVPPTTDPDDVVTVYTKYTDFTGKFVIHCHILDHEDLGMMEVVKVVRPGALLDKQKPVHH